MGRIEVIFNVVGNLVRDKFPTNKRTEKSNQHTLLLEKQLEDKKLHSRRLGDEIKSKKDMPDRRRNRKRRIEVRQEIFQLQDELRASKNLMNTDDRAFLQSEARQRIGPLPDFVVIGAQKCGTSAFYDLLTLHTHVEPAALKELHYFDNHFDEGSEWYRRCFPSSRWKEGYKTITGEATPSYLFRPLVPERMAKYTPDAKLVVLLRNPVDRAYSQYHHQVRLNTEDLDFEAAVRRELEILEGDDKESEADHHKSSLRRKEFSYISRGIYADQLLRWFKFFDREQIIVIKSEDFFRDVAGTMKIATNFLSLPNWEIPERRPRNTAYYTPISQATRRWLAGYFEPHNQRLYEILNKDFDW